MRPELRKEMLRILKEGKDGGVVTLYFGDQPMTIEAAYLLKEHGALEEQEATGSYRITLSGYDYYQSLKAPKIYWVKKNWFPIAVLLVTVGSHLLVAWLG